MANTGYVGPQSTTQVDRGATAWIFVGDLFADDADGVQCNGPGSDYLVGSNYNFSGIPDGSTITGVLVQIKAFENAGGTEPLLAQLQDNTGTLIGTAKTTSNEGNISGSSYTLYTYGSTSDLWGATLTSAIVKNASFGVRFWFTTSHLVALEYAFMQLEYTPPSTWDQLDPFGMRGFFGN